MAVDWSQFQPVAAPQSAAVDWGQFQPVPDETQSGPPEASFRGIRADSTTTATPPSPSPLSQFWSDVKAVPGQMATGAQALVQGGDYQQDPNDQRRVLGVGEGMLRDAADIATSWANQAYQWSPMGVAERTAQQIASNFDGPATLSSLITGKREPYQLPTFSNLFNAGAEGAHKAVGIDEDTMRFQSPRQEAIARFVPELLSNAIPIGGAAHEAESLLASGERALQAEATIGVHGPEAQGQAVADQLTKAAGDLNITPEMRIPADQVGAPDVRTLQPEAAPVVPDATLGEPGAGIGQVPPEAPAAPAPEAAPDLGVAAPEQNPVTTAFAQKLEDHPSAVAEYNAIPETNGGTVLNTDTARELSPDYLADRTKSADVHEPASAFIKRVYADKLAQPTPEGLEPNVLFTAGGTGAGKSSGLAAAGDAIGKPEIVYDTNMNKLESARTKVQQALDAGRKVTIAYTYRDPVEALQNGALKRAVRQEGNFGSGRTVPMAEHEATHLGAYDTVNQLAKDYHDDPRVNILAIDNTHGPGGAKMVPLEELPNPHTWDLRERLHQALDEAHQSGAISDSIYQGFRAESSRGGAAQALESPRGAGLGERPQQADVNASGLREGQGSAGVAREVPAGGEVGSGRHIQFPGEQEPHALPERLRGQRETPTRPVPEPLGPAGIAKEHVAAERERMGWEAVQHDLSRSDPEGWKRAQERTAANPNYARDLTQSIIEKPRPISKEEANALAIDLQRIRTERRAAYAESERAIQAGDTEGAAQARARADRLDDEMANVHQAARHASHEWGQGGRGLQRMANEDYSMAALVQRARVKKGEALSPTERSMMEVHAAEIEKREAAVAAREAAVREAEAKPRNPRVAKDASKRFNDLAEQMKAATRKTLCELA